MLRGKYLTYKPVKSVVWLCAYFLTTLWFSFVFSQNPLAVHGLPFVEWDRPASYLYSHENYNLNAVSLVRTAVLFEILGRDQLANGLSFRPREGWFARNWEQMRLIDVQMARDSNGSHADYYVYRSSYALQVSIWGLYARSLDLSPEDFEEGIRLAGCILSGLTLALIIVWLGAALHWICIPLALLMVPMTVGFVLPAPNMYSVLWAALLPLAISLWTYRAPPSVHFGAIGFSLLFFFLCSPEFASNIAGATAIPAVYYGLLSNRRWPYLALDVTKYALLAIVAFAIAYVLLALKIDGYYGVEGSGFSHLVGRAESWLVSESLADGPKEVGFLDGLFKIAAVSGLTLYGAIALPNILVILLGSAIMVRILMHPTPRSPEWAKLRAWTLTSFYALAVSLSWILLQFHHVAWHPRYAPFLVAYPWFLSLVGVLGLLWATRLIPPVVRERPIQFKQGTR